MHVLTQDEWSRIARHPWLRGGKYLMSVDSTSAYGLDLATRGTDDTPFLVFAERQSRGRGRGVNRWHSSEGALTFSLVWCFPSESNNQPLSCLSIHCGIAICEAFLEMDLSADVGLKWPNDVYLDGRKVAGILIETVDRTPRPYVVGIGINVNNDFEHAPVDVRQRAISLSDVSGGTKICRAELMLSVLDHLSDRLTTESLHGSPEQTEWERFCILRGKQVTVRTPRETISGTCLGLAPDGALRIQSNGATQLIVSGEVLDF